MQARVDDNEAVDKWEEGHEDGSRTATMKSALLLTVLLALAWPGEAHCSKGKSHVVAHTLHSRKTSHKQHLLKAAVAKKSSKRKKAKAVKVRVKKTKTAAKATTAGTSAGGGAWALEDDYSGKNFFNMMTAYTSNDPTHGYVNYLDQAAASSAGLVSVTANGQVYMAADSKSIASGRGRNSVRFTSRKQYSAGTLVVLDLAHMPTGCGTWPAFWTTGPNWPNQGEIDIIEGVDLNTVNSMTLHTSDGCSMNWSSSAQTGSGGNQNCLGNQGCGVQASGSNTYGTGFNAAGGGVYAMQWTTSGISIWFWSNGKSPRDVLGPSPNPTKWGTPQAHFAFGASCSSNHFYNHGIIFDLTFCGDWAGNVYGSSGCPSSCQDYVQNNPQAFKNAYWTVRALKVYKAT